jgi:hypothetical protein
MFQAQPFAPNTGKQPRTPQRRPSKGLHSASIRRDTASYLPTCAIHFPGNRERGPEMHFKHPEKARAAIQKADTLPLRP